MVEVTRPPRAIPSNTEETGVRVKFRVWIKVEQVRKKRIWIRFPKLVGRSYRHTVRIRGGADG